MFPKSVLGISSPVPFPHGGRSRLSEVEKRKLDTECIQSGIPSYLAIRVIWRRLERREERTDDDASIVFASCATSCRSQKVKFGHLFRRELKENSFQWSNNSRTSVLQSSEWARKKSTTTWWGWAETKKKTALAQINTRHILYRTSNCPKERLWKGLGDVHLCNRTKEGFVIFISSLCSFWLDFPRSRRQNPCLLCRRGFNWIGPMTINYHMLQRRPYLYSYPIRVLRRLAFGAKHMPRQRWAIRSDSSSLLDTASQT